jgi:hypothetical protein
MMHVGRVNAFATRERSRLAAMYGIAVRGATRRLAEELQLRLDTETVE